MVSAAKLFERCEPDEVSLLQRTRQLLDSLSDRIQAKRLEVELDFDERASSYSCSSGLTSSVKGLIELAIDRSPECGELGITAVRSARGVEIEISDSGTQYDHTMNDQVAFKTKPIDRIPGRKHSKDGNYLPYEADLFCARCPQGGLAWTLIVPEAMAALKTA